MSEKVNISLSKDEALILLDFLDSFNKKENFKFKNPAEQIVLWGLECLLEKELVEPFYENYSDIITEAYSRINPSDE